MYDAAATQTAVAVSLPGRGRGHSRGFVAADPDRAQNSGRPHPRTPIMRRLHADRGDNPDPGIQCQPMAHQIRSLTSSARLDNEPNVRRVNPRTVQAARGVTDLDLLANRYHDIMIS